MTDRNKIVRYRITFRGRVQGVGFRYRAQHAAMAEGLTGWVRNEYDGSVTMEVQGEEEHIDRMLFSLENDHWIRIDERAQRALPPEPDERAFRITM